MHFDQPTIPDGQCAVPEKEMEITFVRSSGPGGQNVNKTSTKAVVRWNVNGSAAFSDEEKTRINEQLGARLTKEGDLIVTCMKTRSQLQNRDMAVQTLRNLVARALEPEKERRPTKPTRASKERRLGAKERQAGKKRERQKPKWE